MSAMIWAIDHRPDDHQAEGDVMRSFVVRDDHPPGSGYADYCALHTIWTGYKNHQGSPPAIVGFFGYRKYLYLTHNLVLLSIQAAHNPGWFHVTKPDFDILRAAMTTWSSSAVEEALEDYHILQAQPFYIDVPMIGDFAMSRSTRDAVVLANLFKKYRLVSDKQIYPYLFIMRWELFDFMMDDLDMYRREIEADIEALDSTDVAYKTRPMAYIMERLYTGWLESYHKMRTIKMRTAPLMHCWDM
jgi:hypothetical protein